MPTPVRRGDKRDREGMQQNEEEPPEKCSAVDMVMGMQINSVDVAEVYSPPRVTAMASKYELNPEAH